MTTKLGDLACVGFETAMTLGSFAWGVLTLAHGGLIGGLFLLANTGFHGWFLTEMLRLW